MAKFHPPNHSAGDPNTIGGYLAVHSRPAAFEGPDGASYSVEVVTDQTGDPARPWGAYLLFVRWGQTDHVAVGHLETPFLVYSTSEDSAAARVYGLLLSEAREHLHNLVRKNVPEATFNPPERAWYEVMNEAEESGIVLSGTGGVWRVLTSGGETLEVSLRGRLKKEDGQTLKLAVGDQVIVRQDSRGEAWAIEEIEPRRSVLSRREPGGRYGERILAANIDQVIIVFSAAQPEPQLRMLDRFLIITEASELKPVIVVNKVDLVGDEQVRKTFEVYSRIGYDLHTTSAIDGTGIDEFKAALSDMTSVLTGPSGVGKSSLINAIYPNLNLRVGEVSEAVNKGRHTTVGATLVPLPESGYIVDTPGLREVGLWGFVPEEFASCFPEFVPYIGECRFGDCSHRHEPGCEIRNRVTTGDISAERYESYVTLLAEIEEAEKIGRLKS